jgi:type I restriction enzyme, R subunit
LNNQNSNFSSHDTEADTCRKLVLPRLKDSLWTDDQIMEQRQFTDGKIVIVGRKANRKKAKKADFLLRYAQNYLIAVVEAKADYKEASDGMQQAKNYALILGVKFAYATNGIDILEYDFITGLETKIESFPKPIDLWQRINDIENINPTVQDTFLKPFYPIQGKEVRYYQSNAINSAVKAILQGTHRALLTLATGTGKTTVAFQIIYKLWNNRWNLKGEYRRPKILFLADRSILVSDPHAKDFAMFGDARCLVPEEGLLSSREVYFSTYQSLAEDANRLGAFRELPQNFFDLIVIDECHRGSANEDSNWRVILDYFNQAVHLGLTATPLRDDNKDTYLYFGNPLYTYTLRQGIEDGFLAPYIVHRIVPEIDATGFRPQQGQVDDKGELITDELYTTRDFENSISYLPRTKAVAKHLFEFMCRNGRYDKTIVFCVNQEHASQFTTEINNLNADITKQYPNYTVRIVADEGDIGKGHLSNFMDIDEPFPVVVTTSKLMSTGVDVPTCKNIVLFRMVNSMTEFKQIIGRGTRVRQDKEKLFFTILDYTGSATRQFADPEFDGDPPLITQEEIDANGQTIPGTEQVISTTTETDLDNDTDTPTDDDFTTGGGTQRRKFYVSDGEVTIAAETVQIVGADGRLVTMQFTQYAKEQITTLFPTENALTQNWCNTDTRNKIIEQLQEAGISFEQLADITKLKDASMFDILRFVAYDLKPLTRKQRADLLLKNKPDFLTQYSEKAQQIINLIVDKYVEFGEEQLRPDIIAVDPFTQFGNNIEITNQFGGVPNFINTINQIQVLLYAA